MGRGCPTPGHQNLAKIIFGDRVIGVEWDSRGMAGLDIVQCFRHDVPPYKIIPSREEATIVAFCVMTNDYMAVNQCDYYKSCKGILLINWVFYDGTLPQA
jgi:hypothetical protein